MRFISLSGSIFMAAVNALETFEKLKNEILAGKKESNVLAEYDRALNSLLNVLVFKRSPFKFVSYTPCEAEERTVESCRAWAETANTVNEAGETLLHTMFANPILFNRKLLLILLSQGWDLSAKNKLGETPLQIAVKSENKDMVAAILDFYIQGKLGEMNVRQGINIDFDARVTEITLEIMLKLPSSSPLQETVLQRLQFQQLLDASRMNDTKTIQELLDKGVDLNCGSHKCLPLIEAVTHNCLDAVKILLKAGADLTKTAVNAGHSVVMSHRAEGDEGQGNGKELWYGSDGYFQVRDYISVYDTLNTAINLGFTEIAAVLISHKHPLRDGGNGPLNVAMEKNRLEIGKLLLEANATMTGKGEFPHYNVMLCATRNLPDLIPFLTERGANVHQEQWYRGGFVDLLTLITREILENFSNPMQRKLIEDRCNAAVLLIKQGANPKSADEFIDYSYQIIRSRLVGTPGEVNDEFLRIDMNRAKRTFWINRRELFGVNPTDTFYSAIQDLFEVYHYRWVLDFCINSRYIAILESYADVEYYHLTRDFSLGDRKMLSSIVNRIAKECAGILLDIHHSDILEERRKIGIEDGIEMHFDDKEVTKLRLRTLLVEMLQNIFKQNLTQKNKIFQRIENLHLLSDITKIADFYEKAASPLLGKREGLVVDGSPVLRKTSGLLLEYGMDPEPYSDLREYCNKMLGISDLTQHLGLKEINKKLWQENFNQEDLDEGTKSLYMNLVYRNILSDFLVQNHIALLVKFVDVTYFKKTGDYTQSQVSTLEQIIDSLAKEATIAILTINAEDIKFQLEFLGIENTERAISEVRILLERILQNQLRLNSSPIKVFTPYLIFTETQNAHHAISHTAVRKMIEEYTGMEKSGLTVDTYNYQPEPLPDTVLGPYDCNAIKEEILKLDELRLKAAREVLGGERELRFTAPKNQKQSLELELTTPEIHPSDIENEQDIDTSDIAADKIKGKKFY